MSTDRTESSIQRSVVEYAREKGFIAIKLTAAGRFGSAGWPDYMFISPWAGVFMVEFKAPGKHPTPLQRRRHKELSDNGIDVTVIDDVRIGKWLINKWCEDE